MRILLFSLLLFVCCTAGVAARQLDWCAGTQQLKANSAVSFEDNSLNFSICTVQKRFLSNIASARFRVAIAQVDMYVDLCSSRMDCLAKSTTPNAAGLYCYDGHAEWLIPDWMSSQPVSLHLYDAAQVETAVFCSEK